jgi:predicted N-acetyltransferase YhbS
VHGYEMKSMETFERSFSASESQALDTPARREAWYLAMLAVDPVLQGQGIGQLLLRHDLRNIDQGGVYFLAP